MSSEQPLLTTPKGIFFLGYLLGAMSVLSVGFLLVTGGIIDVGRLAGGQATGSAPEAAAPADQDTVQAQQPAPIPADPRPVTKDDHVRGTGPMTIIEYADLQCPFCKRFHSTMQDIMKNDAGKVKWVYRHFPLTSIHEHAEKLAEASECANDQGKFWEFIDVTFAQDAVDAAKASDYAKQAGVKDLKTFQKCLDSGTYADKVAADAQDATSAGGDGTPFSILIAADGRKQEIAGALPTDQVQAMINAYSK